MLDIYVYIDKTYGVDTHRHQRGASQHLLAADGWTPCWTWRIRITPTADIPSSANQALKGPVLPNGDRVLLPPSFLNELLNINRGDSNLPQPLTFVLSRGRRRVYCSVRDFTSEQGTITVGSAISDALEASGGDTILVKWVVLEKGEAVKLVPLNSAYLTIDNMRATLESNLRKNYATLTKGETITIQHTFRNLSTGHNDTIQFSFLVADLTPSVDGVVIINTDLEVDIVPLDSRQAEDAVKAKHQVNDNITSSNDSTLNWSAATQSSTTRALVSSSVHVGATSYHQVTPLPNVQHYNVEIEKLIGDVDLYISFQQTRPSEMHHDYSFVDSSNGKVAVSLTNVDPTHPLVYFAVRNASKADAKYQLLISPTNDAPEPKVPHDVWAAPTEEAAPADCNQCTNCHQWIPKQSLQRHEAFCLRNNSYCPRCRKVFQKSEFGNHWHCDDCDHSGHIDTKDKHRNPRHGAVQCPDRYIFCRYCHLRQKAGPPCMSPKDWMLGLQLSEHESECGARTIECVTCKRPVQLKEATFHMNMHDMEKREMIMNGPRQTFKLCSNVECSSAEPNPPNVLRVCTSCYAPFWSPRLDDGNTRLAQKLLETYHRQLTKGCGRPHCLNQYCRTFLKAVEDPDPTDAAIQALNLVQKSALVNKTNPICSLCTPDSTSERRRKVAEELSGIYHVAVSNSVRALQLSNDDEAKAHEWLSQLQVGSD
ncbi:hypothetical protein SeMB42_g07508 [Synchytrium endobioticum]|uniref:Uncharacterized protein n=1 Tax=Synchytrium endobioticum TaxID=286115 RepID=A0A507C578_9FUNG|nr:hypothetical protein SeMB42_g07508 [Synchytrium endobioticum]